MKHTGQQRGEGNLSGACLWLMVGITLIASCPGRGAEPAHDRVASLNAVLHSTAGQKEKADACRELARIGTKESVPALAALLGDENLSHMARYGLETIPDPSVDKAFRDAVGTLQGRQLAGVIGSIGVRRDPKAIKPLATLLVAQDRDVAQAAARALGNIATPSAAKALQKSMSSTAQANQFAVYEGLFRCAEKFAAQGKNKASATIYDWVGAQEQAPLQVWTAALRGSVLVRGPAGLPILIQALAQNDFGKFVAAARVSHELPGTGVTQALASQLLLCSGDKQILLLQTLGKRKDPAALPAVSMVAKAKGKPAGGVAIRTISEFCDESALSVFSELLEDRDTEIAQAALEGMASLAGEKTDAAIKTMLESKEASRQSAALEMVGRRRMTSAFPKVLVIARGQDATLRLTAIRRARELAGTPDLLSVLRLLGEAETQAELDATEQALEAIIGRATKPDGCVELLASDLGQAKSPQKCALVRVLGSIGGSKALSAVREALKDPTADVRTTAIRTLGTWNNADTAPDLLELARTCSDPAEKSLSLRSYIGLARQSELAANKRLEICREGAALAQQDEEKKLVLGALGSIQVPEAAALVERFLNDAAIKEEATAACVGVADGLLKSKESDKYAAQLIGPLQKAAQNGASPELTKKAQSLLEQAQTKAGAAK